MGTNFYLFSRNKKLVTSLFSSNDYELTDEPEFGYQIHVAKTSAGWKPLFQQTQAFSSIRELKKVYDSGDFKILNEYNDEYTWPHFKNRVIHWGDNPKNHIKHIDYVKNHPDNQFYLHVQDDYFVDPDGYEFTKHPFS